MSYSPLSIARRHVLGELYARCNEIETVPVYITGDETEPIGHVDEGLGHYADAFRFHLTEENCKKLSSGHFTFSFSYEYIQAEGVSGSSRRIKLNSIFLNPRKAYQKPVPKNAAKLALAEETAVTSAAIAENK